MKKTKKTNDLKVFISSRNSKCGECGEELGRKAWITLEEGKGALCLSCADLNHLVFLPSGDTALTRRSRKYSTLVAVVLKWSKARKRYERQGLLVEQQALEQAEQECLEDSDVRARKRERAAVRRAEIDDKYISSFAKRVRKLFPHCPPDRENNIAEHACMKYSGRVGRTQFAKQLDEKAIHLAVIAHIRHTETKYDELLSKGYERGEARKHVMGKVDQILHKWESI
ncbi:hypothetical protein MHK_008126 [Candidatus Magnetomorum sp. HK-1]|nr:hypothetical protein MHK_008126 [Candidatus Magnetomorum sp. HK-1]